MIAETLYIEKPSKELLKLLRDWRNKQELNRKKYLTKTK